MVSGAAVRITCTLAVCQCAETTATAASPESCSPNCVSFGPSNPGSNAKVGAPCETKSAGAVGTRFTISARMRCGECLFGIFECAGDSSPPFALSGIITDQVLANFDFHIRQGTGLRVVRYGVVGLVADKVGLVIRDHQLAFPPQHVEHDTGKTAIAIVKNRGVHVAAHALVDIGHGVLRHQDGGPACRQPLVDKFTNPPMIRIEDLGATHRDVGGTQIHVAGYLAGLTDMRN